MKTRLSNPQALAAILRRTAQLLASAKEAPHASRTPEEILGTLTDNIRSLTTDGTCAAGDLAVLFGPTSCIQEIAADNGWGKEFLRLARMLDWSAVAPKCKISWQGRVISVQPRIRLNRSFDERTHSYLGYVLQLEGIVDDEERVFTVGLGKAANAKHAFRVGDEVSGQSMPVEDPRMEPAEFYKTSKLKLAARGNEARGDAPPFLGVPPDLPTYRRRGHRRLAAKTYEKKCTACIWGCRMPVEMTIDHWNPEKKKYRFETFCYGPKSCANYRPGAKRKVPGRKGMVHVEEDWIDEEATAHRGEDA